MTQQFLDKPVLPQVKGGMLDMGKVAGDAVLVTIPLYDQIDNGDRIVVQFRGKDGQKNFARYSYVARQRNFPPLGFNVDIQPLTALSNGSYAVTYEIESRALNAAKSNETDIVVSNARAPESNVQYHQATYLGTFASGTIDAWIAPFDYSIASPADVKHAVWPGASGQTAATLTLWRQPAGKSRTKIGELSYAGNDWQFTLSAGAANIVAGDELSFDLSADASLSVLVMV